MELATIEWIYPQVDEFISEYISVQIIYKCPYEFISEFKSDWVKNMTPL